MDTYFTDGSEWGAIVNVIVAAIVFKGFFSCGFLFVAGQV
jgi:hypothetical protein